MQLNTSIHTDLPYIPPKDSATFFVVLHGAISLVQAIGENGPDELRAHLIDAPGVHQCLAGTWLAEIPIPRGFVASFVCDQAAPAPRGSLSPLDLPVVRLKAFPEVRNPQYHAVFTFPPPNAIHHFNRARINLNPLPANSPLVAQPLNSSAVHVLEYSLTGLDPDFGLIQLLEGDQNAIPPFAEPVAGAPKVRQIPENQIFWTCPGPTKWASTSQGLVASLHIFNFPFSSAPVDHSKDEFDRSTAALGAAEVTLDVSSGRATGTPVPDGTLPAGLSKFELLGLENRLTICVELLDFLRTGEFDSRSVAVGGGGSDVGCYCAGGQVDVEPAVG